jgi:hypothetical protein
MTVKEVKEIVKQAIDAKFHLDESSASLLQVEIEKFLVDFKDIMEKDIDSAKNSLVVSSGIERSLNDLRQAYGL